MKSLTFLLLFICLIGCSEVKKDFVIATSSEGATYFKIGEALSESLSDDGYNIQVLSGPQYSTVKNCQLVAEGKVDFALAQNDTPIEQIFRAGSTYDHNSLRTIIPIYPEIIFIIYPDSLHPQDLADVIVGRRVGIGPRNSGTSRFMKILFSTFGIDSSQYIPIYTDFDDNTLNNPDIDISCAVTGINNPRIIDIIHRQGGKIFSLDDFNLANRGSSVDGFCINYPRSRPFIIPKNTYGELPESPILTLAIDAILITNRSQDDYDIQQFVKTIFDNAQSLSNRNTLLGLISESFESARMNFPLHDGVKAYLERNEPSLVERYAELIGVVFSIIVVVGGGVSSAVQRSARKKKENINGNIAALRKYWINVREVNDPQTMASIEQELFELKLEVLNKLAENKIGSDSALNSFLDEWERVNEELKSKSKASLS